MRSFLIRAVVLFVAGFAIALAIIYAVSDRGQAEAPPVAATPPEPLPTPEIVDRLTGGDAWLADAAAGGTGTAGTSAPAVDSTALAAAIDGLKQAKENGLILVEAPSGLDVFAANPVDVTLARKVAAATALETAMKAVAPESGGSIADLLKIELGGDSALIVAPGDATGKPAVDDGSFAKWTFTATPTAEGPRELVVTVLLKDGDAYLPAAAIAQPVTAEASFLSKLRLAWRDGGWPLRFLIVPAIVGVIVAILGLILMGSRGGGGGGMAGRRWPDVKQS